MDKDRLADIEDLMIATLKAKTELAGINIETREVPLTEEELDKMLGKAPFIYIEYAGGASVAKSEDNRSRAARHEYNLFVAAKNLRTRKEAQRGSYELLTHIFNALDGTTAEDEEISARAAEFEWQSQAAVYVTQGGTVYQAVYTVTESII